MGNHPRWYDRLAALPLAIFLVLASLWVSIDASGMSDPLPYVPLINPLTLTLLAILVVLFGWLRQVGAGAAQPLGKLVWMAKLAWGVLAFVVFNAALARDIHHLMAIPFDWSSLFASEILQTTYAIVWSIIALVLMIWANRKGKTDHGWAAVWFFGAAVLALTVLKLFIIDLANTGAIARIVSFMGVGLLIIIIAYYAPVSSTLSDVRENETNA